MLRTASFCTGLLLLTANVHADGSHKSNQGAVFTLTNEADANRVLAFARDRHGALAEPSAFATEGRGSGDALGSQGALALSEDGQFLLATNAGTNDVSVFAVHGAALELRSRVSSGGTRPISISESCGLVFVLNAGDAANVSGFTLDRHGRLQAIDGATAALSGEAVGAAQVQLTPDARTLVVTEKTANQLVSFRVNAYGRLGDARITPSAGMTPFGFDISQRGYVIVSEAGTGSASSYESERSAALEPITRAVADTQMAPCWVTISPDDRYAFVANAGSASLSSYTIGSHGQITLQNARAGEVGDDSHPLDLAISREGDYLYALDRGQSVVTFKLDHEGTLERVGAQGSVPMFSAGLAAY
jgi:6-phosphogluconolactonase